MGRNRKSRLGYKVPGGRLTVVKCAGKNEKGVVLWECECSCKPENPNRVLASWDLLRNGKKSCGCLKRGTHGPINAFLRSPNRKAAVEWWKQGGSLNQISKRVEVSKQRVHQYVKEYLSSLGEKERVEAKEAHGARSHGRDPIPPRGA